MEQMEDLLRIFVWLHIDSYCHFPSLSWNLFFLFQSIFTCHSYFSDVQHTTVLPTASRVTAKVKLFGLCSCTTALALWQREGNKERFSSVSQCGCHGVTCTFKSLKWVISPKRQKHVPDCIPSSIYAHFTTSWLFLSRLNSTPLKEREWYSFSHENEQKNKQNLSPSFPMNIF